MSGCGGGGGGGGPSPALRDFTSWSAVQSPSTTVVPGIASEIAYTYDLSEEVVTSVGEPSPVTDITFTQTLNAAGQLTRLQFTTPSGGLIDFNTASGSAIADLGAAGFPGLLAAVDATLTSMALSGIPEYFGWNYQSFGTWQTDIGTGSGAAGLASVGAPTPVGGIPTTGSAIYYGIVGGQYADPEGKEYIIGGDLTADVSFGDRSLSVNATNIQKTQDLMSFSNAPELNFTGTATYASNSNRFTGTLKAPGLGLEGLAGNTTGQFYGPNAQELGGVGFLRAPTGVESLGVSYGARR